MLGPREEEVLTEVELRWREGSEVGIRVLEVLPNSKVDALAELTINETKKNLLIEVKSSGYPYRIREAVMQLREAQLESPADFYPVVASSYISPEGRRLCRQAGIGYLDAAGNMYINTTGVYIDKETNQKPESQQARQKKLFTPKATRVYRALLEEPQRAWRLAEMADTTDISIGMVHKVSERLADAGYAARGIERRLILIDPEGLLEAWADSYRFSEQNDVTRLFSTLSSKQGILERISSQVDLRYALTLFAGADLVAPITRFNETVLFVDRSDVGKWQQYLAAERVDSGPNLVLAVPYDRGVYYRRQKREGLWVVSNTQLYLDLFNYTARGRDQAEHLARVTGLGEQRRDIYE